MEETALNASLQTYLKLLFLAKRTLVNTFLSMLDKIFLTLELKLTYFHMVFCFYWLWKLDLSL